MISKRKETRRKSDKLQWVLLFWAIITFLFILEFRWAVENLETKFEKYETEKSVREKIEVVVSLKEYDEEMNEFHKALQEMQDFVFEGEAK